MEYLLGTDGATKWDLRCMSIYHDNEGHYMDQHKDMLTGRMMGQWWDRSDQAGPAARVHEPFSQEIPPLECVTICDGEVKPLRLCSNGCSPHLGNSK
jgi:hypothetical protein